MISRKEINDMGLKTFRQIADNIISVQTLGYTVLILMLIVGRIISIELALSMLFGAFTYLAFVIIIVQISLINKKE